MPKRKSIPRRKRSTSRRRGRSSKSARRRSNRSRRSTSRKQRRSKSTRRSKPSRRRSTRRSKRRSPPKRSKSAQQNELVKWFKETYPSYRLSWQVKAALNDKSGIIHITKGDIKKAVNVTISKDLKTLQLKHFSKVSPHQISLVTTKHYSEARPTESRHKSRGTTLTELREVA